MIALAALHPVAGVEGDALRALVAMGAGILLGIFGWSRLRGDVGATLARSDRLPLLAVLCVLGVAALQLVPLPSGLIGVLAPETAELYRLDMGLAQEGWRAISIEPVATARSLLLGLAYVAVFVVACALGRRRELTTRVAAGLGIVGAAVTLLALVHSQDRIGELSRPTSPFLNPNHLATFLTLCLGPALGVALTPQSRSPVVRSVLQRVASLRGLALFSLATIVTGLFLSLSRGGLIAAAACVVLTVLLSGAMAREGDEVVRRRRWIGLGVGIGALVIGILISNYAVVQRFEQTGRSELTVGGRVEIWSVTLDVIGGRPLAGSGLGTYDDASFAALTPDRGVLTRPESAHNDYLELASDVGLPAAIVALLGVALLTLRAAKRLPALEGQRRAVTAGLLAGAVGALVHATVEFGLQIPGPALLLAACLGLSWGATLRGGSRSTRRSGYAPVVCGVCLVACGALVFAQASREAAGSAASARVHAKKTPEGIRDRALDALPVLQAAQGWWATAKVAQQLADAACVQTVPDYPLAVAQARQAVARAPGRAHAQMQLAYLLLDERWRTLREQGLGAEERAALRREGQRRLSLAVRLGPTHPQVLLLAGSIELDAFIASRSAAKRERAQELLARALRYDEGLRPVVRRIVTARAAQLGTDGLRVRVALGLDERRP